MKGDARVIDYLNQGLRYELTAVNRFWQHPRTLADWGYNELAGKWREESAEERERADRLNERITFPEGATNMQELNALRVDQGVREILENDPAVEYGARRLDQEAAYCVSIGDRVSKDMFEELMADEEGHIDFLEIQLTLIEQVGPELYAQKHVGRLGKDEGHG
ncbi:bacterioferritin [Microvirga sp. Mcv34]|uniref:bacterioferritin n=1 Tax=Microvirga sp. Mcv34 TaxID=2926016 RepID=UPI0021CAB8EC|nr:bacterioferritin [Microvirga sp. Mcv34]